MRLAVLLVLEAFGKEGLYETQGLASLRVDEFKALGLYVPGHLVPDGYDYPPQGFTSSEALSRNNGAAKA